MRRFLRAAGKMAPWLLAAAPLPAFAHAFGQSYTLPLPVSLYIFAAAAAVIASFVILSLFAAPRGEDRGRAYPLPAFLRGRAAAVLLRGFGAAMLLGTIFTGYLGMQEPTQNPALFLFWIALLLIMTYVSALISGVWERIDPLRAMLVPLFGEGYRPLLPFPAWLRYVPPLLFYFWLIWFELLSYGAGADPRNVATLVLAYIAASYFGAGLFGSKEWFAWGDFFSVFFSTIGRFAPLKLGPSDIRVMPPGERLVRETPESPTLVLFILFMLSSTSFDGLHETQPWVRFFVAHPFLEQHYAGVVVGLLLVSPFIFLALFSLAAFLMRCIVRTRSTGALVMRFSLSLIPIAIAYSVAHYFSLVVSEGQRAIPMLSDPLGTGADFFGTASYVYNPALLSAQALWYLQVAAIVIGHVAATYIAHRIALREFSARSQALASQLPMVVLMVIYTGIGLWILSLPYAIGA